jgi:predicted ATPase/class 3 adenylate cyclase
MAELPTGTVTFLFTDVEGSTRLWEEQREAMQSALARHDVIVRAAIEAHQGRVVKTTGDGFHGAFATASDAVEAAIAAQLGLADESWAETGPLRVRIGIHSGRAELRDGDYYGPAVNRAARLMSSAHGGQIVVSLVTEELIRDGAVELVDLGEHALRDLARPERLFQVAHPGLERDFARLSAMDAFPGNLPVQSTSFVGRDLELVGVAKALAESRLVTLTGVGGVGKTRLALQVAAEVLPRFAEGAWLCELATASDEVLMFQTVADALGVLQREGLSMADSVVEYLRDRELLVVLDNCEHLLSDAAWLVSELLQRCPRVRILATSREGLGVIGEQLVALASLPVPRSQTDPDVLASADAVRLFADRAAAARSGFTLGPGNVVPVAEICRRLDGMPLAIELAAARVTAMRPAEIAAHLDERFRLLTGGRRSRVERHQTLRATVEWSYSLLEPAERLVFDRLGVFVGSFDAAAAQAVVADDDLDSWDVLDALAGLVEKSMILAGDPDDTDDGSNSRYRLLETLRAFAREQLEDREETDHWRRRHADYYADWCEHAGPELVGPREQSWARRVEEELDNIWAALRWGLDAPEQDDADLALRILIALLGSDYSTQWGLYGWADTLLLRARTSTLPGHATTIAAAAYVHINLLEDPDVGDQLAWEALRVPNVNAAPRAISLSYTTLGSVRFRQDQPADALEVLSEGLRSLDAVGASPADRATLHSLASLIETTIGDLEAAQHDGDTALEMARSTGSPLLMAGVLANAGRAWFSHDPDRALAAFEESIALSRHGFGVDISRAGAAQLRARAGDRAAALTHLREAIAGDHDIGYRAGIGYTVERAVAILSTLREDELAALCAGIVQARVVTGFRTLPQADDTAARVAARLGADAYNAAYNQGAALTYEQVGPALVAALDELLATAHDIPEPTPATRS